MENVVVCAHCEAKLRVKPAALKVMKELRCGRCLKSTPIPPELKAAAMAGQVVAGDAAPAPGAPTPAAPTGPTPIRMAAPPTPKPMPAPVLRTPPTPGATPAPATPAAAAGDAEARINGLEARVASLETRLKAVCDSAIASAQQKAEALAKLQA